MTVWRQTGADAQGAVPSHPHIRGRSRNYLLVTRYYVFRMESVTPLGGATDSIPIVLLRRLFLSARGDLRLVCELGIVGILEA